MRAKNKRSIKFSLNGRDYRMVLRKEKGIKKDYLTLLLPKTLKAKVSEKIIQIIPIDV